MADRAEARRILLALPEVVEDEGRFRFTVRGRPLCWPWLQRLEAGKRRVAREDVLGVRVAGEAAKQDLLALGAPFFSEPHYDGYPAILVRLPEIDSDLLREVLTGAWRIQAPRALVKAFDAS